MKLKICSIGDVGIDEYVDLRLKRPGGCTLNFSCHFKLVDPNAYVTILSVLGTRTNNRSIFECLEHYDIEYDFQYIEGESPLQPIRLHTNGEKIFYNYSAGVLKDFRLSNSQKSRIAVCDLVMLPLFRGSEEILNQIVEMKSNSRLAIDFMDLSDYKKNLMPIMKYLELASFSFFGLSKDDTDLISELKLISKNLNKIFIVTLGENGVLAIEKGAELKVPSLPISQMKDSTGAGDSFAAAFLAYHLKGYALPDSLRFANTHAARTVTYVGAIPFTN